MLALLSILITLALLGLIVLALHKYQTMEVEYNVDRTMPLPPLDGNETENPAAEKTTQSAAGNNPKNTPPKSNSARLGKAAKPGQSAAEKWDQQALRLKQAGNYQGALAVCQNELPLWGAFKQVTVILRHMLQTFEPQSAEYRKLLRELYETAVLAELLHDKTVDFPKLKLNQLRQIDLAEAGALDFPYEHIGYAHIRLLSKGDIKQMLELWSRPAQHEIPRKYHVDWWLDQVTRLNR